MEQPIAGGQEPVKTPDSGVKNKVVTAPEPQVDYEAILAAKEAEIAKISQEKENYRRAALKAKGKLPDEPEEGEETVEEKMRRIAQETFLSTREAQAQAEKDALIKKMARENSEMKLALQNRSQMTPAGGTAGPAEEAPVKDNILSENQLKELRLKFPHWTDKEIQAFKDNLNK